VQDSNGEANLAITITVQSEMEIERGARVMDRERGKQGERERGEKGCGRSRCDFLG
jgi:hypothetical protein